MSRGWIRRLWPYLMAHRTDVIVAFGAALVGLAVSPFTPLIQKVIIDVEVVAAAGLRGRVAQGGRWVVFDPPPVLRRLSRPGAAASPASTRRTA